MSARRWGWGVLVVALLAAATSATNSQSAVKEPSEKGPRNRHGADVKLLQAPAARFPNYKLFDLADWLEQAKQ